jgi:hypothetical protein
MVDASTEEVLVVLVELVVLGAITEEVLVVLVELVALDALTDIVGMEIVGRFSSDDKTLSSERIEDASAGFFAAETEIHPFPEP